MADDFNWAGLADAPVDYFGSGGSDGISLDPSVSTGGLGGILGGLGGVASGLLNYSNQRQAGNTLQDGLQNQLAQADPYGQYRPNAAAQLNNFMQNPGSYLSTPYAKAITDAGQQAVERSYAAKGYNGSGNIGTALTQFGQNNAAGLMNNYFNQLFQTSGAGSGQLAGADIVGNIAGLQAARQTGYGGGSGTGGTLSSLLGLGGSGGGGGDSGGGIDLGQIASIAGTVMAFL